MSSKFNVNQSNANIGIGVSEKVVTEQIAGIIHNYASQPNLAEAAAQIQQLLIQLQTQGCNPEEAQKKVASNLANLAKNDSKFREKLVKWGQSLGDVAARTTVTEAATAVIKLALATLGIPLP